MTVALDIALTISLGALLTAAALATARAIRPGQLGDRAVAIDMLTAVFTCVVLVAAALTRQTFLLEVALVLGLLGFLTSVTVGRFIERRNE
jgi:multicomponent Na+:H+ antiporter subunit F